MPGRNRVTLVQRTAKPRKSKHPDRDSFSGKLTQPLNPASALQHAHVSAWDHAKFKVICASCAEPASQPPHLPFPGFQLHYRIADPRVPHADAPIPTPGNLEKKSQGVNVGVIKAGVGNVGAFRWLMSVRSRPASAHWYLLRPRRRTSQNCRSGFTKEVRVPLSEASPS